MWSDAAREAAAEARQKGSHATGTTMLGRHPMNGILGTELHPDDRKAVLGSYVNRHTGDHPAAWAQATNAPLHFKNDQEWLANTRFAVKSNGRLDNRVRSSYSSPTFPNNPELRK